MFRLREFVAASSYRATDIHHTAGHATSFTASRRTKRGQDLFPSQHFRQLSLWATRLDDCRHQAHEADRAKKLIGRLQRLMLEF